MRCSLCLFVIHDEFNSEELKCVVLCVYFDVVLWLRTVLLCMMSPSLYVAGLPRGRMADTRHYFG